MRTFAIYGATLATVAVLGAGLGACSDGSNAGPVGAPGSGGMVSASGGMPAATAGSSALPTAGTNNNTPTAGSGTGLGTAGTSDPGTGGMPVVTGGSSTGGTGVVVTGGSDAGGMPTGGTGAGGAVNTGPFKILILSTALEFAHDSIQNCQYMLGLESAKATAVKDWAQAAPLSTQWTSDLATDDLAQFTDATLKNYAMVFSCSPTGTVFSGNAKVKDKAGAMAAFQHFVENGGAWGGIHSATDFENKGGFPWFTNILAGAYFVTHDNDGTSGTVQLDATNKTHPMLTGLQSSYSTQDEWYKMNRDVSAQPGFLILQRLAVDNRPLTWVKEIANPSGGTGGRMFNTVRGHNKSVYKEAEFRKTVLQGILWATRRM